MVGLHKSINLSFLIVRHTKFSPDWCFGLLKQKFKRTAVNSLDDLVGVVDQSAVVNVAQLVGSQSGEVIVPTYNWAEHLGPHFDRIQHIKAQHHFHFTSSRPGEVITKKFCDSDKVTHCILRDPTWRPNLTDLPPVVLPKGLSLERKWYLYTKIREFCSTETRDQVCPLSWSWAMSSISTTCQSASHRTILLGSPSFFMQKMPMWSMWWRRP